MLRLKILSTTLLAFDAFHRDSVHMCNKMLMEAKTKYTCWQRLVPTCNRSSLNGISHMPDTAAGPWHTAMYQTEVCSRECIFPNKIVILLIYFPTKNY